MKPKDSILNAFIITPIYFQLKELRIEENVNSFYKAIEKNGTSWLELELFKFFRLQIKGLKEMKYLRDY